jgi:DNA-binding transcriptional ArsR family regulator
MSAPRRSVAQKEILGQAPLFSALGDEARLQILSRLGGSGPLSIARLTDGAGMTRQGVTKHLHVLAGAGLVRGIRAGRETLFEVESQRLHAALRFLEMISAQWDERLARLKTLVEE